MYCGKEVSGGLVVSSCDSSELLEPAVEILDEVARLVNLLVVGSLANAVSFGRNDRGFTRGAERLDDALIGIEGLVGQQSVGLHIRQQRIGALQIMGLAGGKQEGERIAEGVDQGVNFGAQPAFAASDRLVFFWEPALCWWARTIVLSIMAYSLSASAAKRSNSFFHTPRSAHRLKRV